MIPDVIIIISSNIIINLIFSIFFTFLFTTLHLTTIMHAVYLSLIAERLGFVSDIIVCLKIGKKISSRCFILEFTLVF